MCIWIMAVGREGILGSVYVYPDARAEGEGGLSAKGRENSGVFYHFLYRTRPTTQPVLFLHRLPHLSL